MANETKHPEVQNSRRRQPTRDSDTSGDRVSDFERKPDTKTVYKTKQSEVHNLRRRQPTRDSDTSGNRVSDFERKPDTKTVYET